MKHTVRCGRCDAKIDIEEGMRIATCYKPVDKKPSTGHLIEVDKNDPHGAAILAHIEKKPHPAWR